mgnify:CR=1 FL=1
MPNTRPVQNSRATLATPKIMPPAVQAAGVNSSCTDIVLALRVRRHCDCTVGGGALIPAALQNMLHWLYC